MENQEKSTQLSLWTSYWYLIIGIISIVIAATVGYGSKTRLLLGFILVVNAATMISSAVKRLRKK